MRIELRINSQDIAVNIEEVDGGAGGWRLEGIPGFERLKQVELRDGNTIELTVLDEKTGAIRALSVPFLRTEVGTEFGYGGRVFAVTRTANEFRKTAVVKERSGALTAPMSGIVADVFVVEGERVAAHQALATVEAMKVMATIQAPFDGVVSKVYFATGAVVTLGAVVFAVSPLPPEKKQ